MSDLSRRELLGMMAAAPLAGTAGWSPEVVERARTAAHQAIAGRYELKFFTPAEFETVKALADTIIPKDERSGSATEAGAPEFMDYILSEYPDNQVAMRGGLAWLDTAMRRRTGKSFVAASPAERAGVLDEIAYPARARTELSHGVEFFNRFRDMTASAFFSSKMGVDDLQYRGNTFVTEWNGCPPAALAKLGVRYD